MTTAHPNAPVPTHDTRRAKTTGLAVAAVGIIIVHVAVFLNWVSFEGEDDARTGYETDSLVPFIAFLGLGLLIAMLYAVKRARRGQHRGLSLVSMAVGLAATIHSVAFAMNPMGGLERGDDLSADIGVWVFALGALLWTIGSFLLAKEIEGDDHDRTDNYTRDSTRDSTR
jgi:O-antigen/teichoic acid export membrane protein